MSTGHAITQLSQIVSCLADARAQHVAWSALAVIIDRLDDKQEQEILMAREAKVIAALQAKNDTLTKQVASLTAQIPPAIAVKDATDITAEQAAADALGLDANGDPVPQPAAPPQ